MQKHRPQAGFGMFQSLDRPSRATKIVQSGQPPEIRFSDVAFRSHLRILNGAPLFAFVKL
jgi:hypothetical protein